MIAESELLGFCVLVAVMVTVVGEEIELGAV
jgi:hypothetical protein